MSKRSVVRTKYNDRVCGKELPYTEWAIRKGHSLEVTFETETSPE